MYAFVFPFWVDEERASLSSLEVHHDFLPMFLRLKFRFCNDQTLAGAALTHIRRWFQLLDHHDLSALLGKHSNSTHNTWIR